jgi:hypothetical protein
VRLSERVTVVPEGFNAAMFDGMQTERDILSVPAPRESGPVPKELPLEAALRKLCGD